VKIAHAIIAQQAGVKYLGTSDGLFWFNYGKYTFTLDENNVSVKAIKARIDLHTADMLRTIKSAGILKP